MEEKTETTVEFETGEVTIRSGFTLEEQVQQAYSDQPSQDDYEHVNRCLNFLTSEWIDIQRAARIIESYIEEYNRFIGEKVAERVRSLPENARVAIGREGSPSLYVEADSLETVEAVFGDYPDELMDVSDGPVPNCLTYRETHGMCCHQEPVVEDDNTASIENPDKTYVRLWWD